jgi:plastocyanin
MRALIVRSFVVVMLVFVGCAQDGDLTVEGGPSATASPPEESHQPVTVTFTETEFDVEMELDDFYFDPTTIKAPGGSTATMKLFNEGDTAHTFTIDALDVDEQIEPGEANEISVELGDETRYEYYCTFHAESNDMKGSFSLH